MQAVLQKTTVLSWTTQPDMGLRNLTPTSHTAIIALGEDKLPGWQPGRGKQGELVTKWHVDCFGYPHISVILTYAMQKEVVTWRVRWWTHYCLQGQTWNLSPRQIPGKTHWLKSCFWDFSSLLTQSASNLIYTYIDFKKVNRWITDISCLLFEA